MKIRNVLGWLLPLFMAAIPVQSSAQSAQDLTEVKIPCWNCGNPNTDHRRYRNVAIMTCTYGEESGQIDHTCKDQLHTNILLQRDAWIHVDVCSDIEDVDATFGCQKVSVRARFEPWLTVDLPFIDFEDGMLGATVKDIVVNQTLPNGDTVENAYLPNTGILYPAPPHLPYADDHPYHEDNGGEPEDAPTVGPSDETDPDDDSDANDDPGTGGGSSGGGSSGNGSSGNGSGGGGSCNGGQHHAGVP